MSRNHWACGPELDMDVRAFSPDVTGGLRLYKGGGSSQKNYAGLERLYQEQADSARLLRGQAEANLPGAVNSYVGKVNEITGEGYAKQQADMASADMASANAMERSATERELTSMGVNPNDPRFAGSMRSTEVNNAARMAAGKNLARNDAKKFQLAVAQDAVGTFTGQSNSAATQMGNASSGMAGLAQQQAANKQAAAAQRSDNISNAVGGGMAAWGMAGGWKDGGEIPRFKVGGIVRALPVAHLIDAEGDGRNLMENTIAGSLAKRFFKDGGEVEPREIERHMAGGAAGNAQRNAGFFQMQAIAPPPPMQTPQKPSGAQQAIQIMRMAQAGKQAHSAGKNIATKIEAMKTGANLTPEQAAAAKEAYKSAADSVRDTNPQLAAKYDNLGGKLETGQKWFGESGASEAAGKVAESATQEVAKEAAQEGAEQALQQGGAEAAKQVGTEAAASAAGGAANAVPVAGAVLNAADRIASGQDAGQAVGGAAASAAGAKAGAALGTAILPGVGTAIGAALGGGLGGAGFDALFADGGEVAASAEPDWVQTANQVNALLARFRDGGAVDPRAEFSRAWNDDAEPAPTMDGRDGGPVHGPGSHTDDVVPALLSAGEGVLNGEAMALGGKEVMEDLNAQGLALRKRGITPDQIRGLRAARMKKEVA